MRNFAHAREIAKQTKKTYEAAEHQVKIALNEIMSGALNFDSDSDTSVKLEFGQ